MKANDKNRIPHGITAETLRTYKGFEQFTDSEAEFVILTLKRFATLAFKAYQLQKQETQTIRRAA